MNILKKIIYAIWVTIVITLMISFLIYPSSFTPEAVADFLYRYESQLFIMYTLFTLLRGLFLIPSTAFVLAGIILFPEQPWAVLVVSLIGIGIGATAVYYFSDLLGFSERLERKYPKKIERWHKRLNSPKATLIVIAWSFFPFVPTDLICYVAGIVKMPYRYLISGVMIGEIVLVSLYVFYGGEIMDII